MAEIPKIVIRGRRGEVTTEKREFLFTSAQIPQWGNSGFARDYRQNAWEAYKGLDFPNPKDEAWRRTDLKDLQPGVFRLPGENAYLDLQPAPEDLLKPVTADAHGGQVLLLPGGVQASLDKAYQEKGIIFTDLKTAEEKYPEILEKVLGKLVHSGESKFAALAGALAQTGVLLYVPPGVQVEQPLHSLLWGPGANLAYLSHVLVYLDEGSSVTYVHEMASPTETGGQSLHAGIVEIFVGPQANLRFVELQSWGQHVWNFTHERVNVERGGNLDWIFGAIGSHLTKNFSELNLTGEGSTGRLLLKYSLPAITGMILVSLYNVIDRIFVGQAIDGRGVRA